MAAAVAGAVCLVVFPVPTPLLDALLSAQLGVAVVVLLTALGARNPLALSQFPTVLLLATLLRLALNVSTTRLILARADAGEVVAAFGSAVVAGDVLVGAAVFGVITLVQYLVIARGAERVAQVSARFALDGLPGRQLAIDADLRAGLIDPEAARGRRAALDRASSLFGAMDGAMKFVRGDAIAGLAIVGLNVVGGLAIGVGRQGLPLDQALDTYTTLTVGDGLLAQLPAVLTATAAALVVTRVAAPDADGPADAILAEFARDRRALLTAGGLLAGLGLLPGLPALPLLAVGGGLALVGLRADPSGERAPRAAKPHAADPVAPLGLALHPDAAAALKPSTPADVVAQARQALRSTWGVPTPDIAVRLTTDGLPPGGFRVEASEAAVRRGALTAGERFVCPADGDGRPGRHPVTGAPGRWLPGASGQAAATWLAAHAVTAWRQAGPQVLGLQQVAALVGQLEAHAPALVRAVMPRRVDLPALARLLRALLAEGVPLRGLGDVFEALAGLDEAGAPLDAVRAALAGRITATVAPEGHLEALVPDHDAERALREPALAPDAAEALLDGIREALARHPRAALLVAPEVRAAARALTAPDFPGLPVLAARELTPGTRLVPVEVLYLD